MNTSKQVNVMIGVIMISFLLFAGYMANEARRQAEAREHTTERVAERGARLFVNNCRNCHGLEGEGHVAPALNAEHFLILDADNEYGVDPTPLGERDAVHNFLFNTIACGRVNTFMPTWAQRYGGPLSDTQVEQIVTMITEGRWDIVREIAAEHDPELFADAFVDPLPDNYDELPRSQQRELTEQRQHAIEEKSKELHDQILRGEYPDVMTEGDTAVLVQDPGALSVTTRNCGQFDAETASDVRERTPLAAAGAPGATATAGPGATPPPPPPPGTVVAELTDSLRINVTPASAPAGAVTFRAQNAGAIIHELVVIKTDLAPEALPVAGGRADESRLEKVGDTDDIRGRASEDLRVNLQAGKYVLICNVPAHYQGGMRTAFTVQ
jgi:mono/diheme cytochrome c family protein